MSFQEEINKTWDEVTAKANAERAEIRAKFEADLAKIDKRHRKMDIAMKVFLCLSVMLLVYSIVMLNIQANSAASKNDACVEAGGLFIKTFDGYQCYSSDLRQKITVE